MSVGPGQTERILAVHHILAGAGVPHAIGGAVALSLYGAPRQTADIDVNIFVEVKGWDELRLDWQGDEVHLFFSQDELHAAMPAAVQQVRLGSAMIPLVAPEHLVIRKAMLDRDKDWPDIEALFAANPDLDRDEIEVWLRRLAGPDDARLAKLQNLIRRPCT